MRISIKHFLLGAVVASVPMSAYVYVNLKPSIKTESEAANYRTQFLASEKSFKSTTPTEAPHPTSIPTIVPTKVPLPKPSLKPETPNISAEVEMTIFHKETAPNDVQILIEKYAAEYKVDKEMMIHIAHCESGFRANAVNGPYAGVYQFLSSTWKSNRAAMGQDTNPELRFNADEAIETAAFKMSRDGFSAWPVCARKATALLTAK